jgi:tetratricopeptide (TPR) repeat protein
VERCLAKRPEDRYASTADLARDLRGVRDHFDEAASLYAQGPQAVPIPAGRSALERHDQERSLEEAVELFTRAVEIDPGYAYASLGEAYFRLYRLNRSPEHFKLAEAHCRRALTLDDLVGQAWQTLGNIHTEVGRAEEALVDLVKAPGRQDRAAEARAEEQRSAVHGRRHLRDARRPRVGAALAPRRAARRLPADAPRDLAQLREPQSRPALQENDYFRAGRAGNGKVSPGEQRRWHG